jgi:D-inositol-3-phosphate glycosyltransferase
MVRRVAMLSAHTSPLEQLGGGDAGGMNVYVLETARRLARRGIAVDVFTRTDAEPSVVEIEPGVRVRSIAEGCIALAVIEDEDAFDLVHSHYWLSGQIGLVAAGRRGIPLVHSMHTMGRVKNLSLAAGDHAESAARIAAESEIVRLSSRLVANTEQEQRELIGLYGADPARIDVVHPGVDPEVFAPVPQAQARQRLGIDERDKIVLFAGRLQPHKGPDVAIEAVARMASDVRLVIVGGPSGTGTEHPESLSELASDLGVSDRLLMVPPVDQVRLADWYAAADVVCIPSHSESFGLVAVEAQACGTPVVAAAVGGLPTAIVDGVTGTLVSGHDPADYAQALGALINDASLRADMGAKAVMHAADFTWDATVDRLVASYERAAQA